MVLVNIGNAALSGGTAELKIVNPSIGSQSTTISIPGGASKTLTFTFTGEWSTLSQYPMANAILKVTDGAGNTVALYEIAIRVVASS